MVTRYSACPPPPRPVLELQGTQKAILYLMKVCGKVATAGNSGRSASSAVSVGGARQRQGQGQQEGCHFRYSGARASLCCRMC